MGIAACYPDTAPIRIRDDGTFINEWGMIFKDIGLYNEFADFILKDVSTAEEIHRYNFPDPLAPGRYEEAAKTIEKYGEDRVSKADGKQAIQLLIESGRCVYTYFGGSFVELPPKE